MDHASLRLFERAVPAEAERGFALLRDRRALSAYFAPHFPGEHDRLALPIAPGDDPPRVLVTRDGHGVTCLARGMACHAPQVPWPLVEQYLREQHDRVRLGLAQARYRDAPERLSLIHGLRYGHRMTRAEWDDLRMLGPILVRTLEALTKETFEFFAALKAARKRRAAIGEERARFFFGAYLGTAHLMTALAAEEGTLRLALATQFHDDVVLAGRGNWILVNQPERTLAQAREIVGKRARLAAAAVMTPVMIIAWRFSWHRAESLSLLRALAPLIDEEPRVFEAQFDQLVKGRLAEQALLERLPFFVFPQLEVESLESLAMKVEGAAEAARALREEPALALDLAAARAGLWAAAALDAWRPLEHAHREPRTQPRPLESLAEADLRSAVMWHRAHFMCAWPATIVRIGKAALFSCAPIEGLIPIDEDESIITPAGGARFVTGTLIDALCSVDDEFHAPQTVRNDAKVGRNEPCPCGSGKKFKKCCAAEA